uniref:Uncharacterized protein n=1 Tax=Arundo donax TaxID=35708 RepID=A0A0A9CNN5_ARUDO
MSSRRPWR